MRHLALASLLLLCLPACQRDPGEASLSQNVGAAFAPCSESEIKYMATRHNFMTAFRPCGNNNFEEFSWSPDGKHLYFQLVMTGYVMDAVSETKNTSTVPTQSPIGPAAWLNNNQLVVPVGAAEGATDESPRIALYDLEGSTLNHVPLTGLSNPGDLQRAREPGEVLMLADGPSGRTVYRINVIDGAVAPAWPWLTAPVDTFTYTPAADAVSVGRKATVSLHTGASGEELGTWTPALRGALHPEGRWMMLEYTGSSVSIFHQRAWDELSERARAREEQRIEQFEQQLPEGMARTVRPPSLSVVDRTSSKRYAFTGFLGSKFQWYEPTNYYGSFVLWGFEGKQYKRNVLLGNLADRLKTIERGGTIMGVEEFVAPTEPEPVLTEGAAKTKGDAQSF